MVKTCCFIGLVPGKGHIVRSNDAAFFVNPDHRRHIRHMIEFRYHLTGIQQTRMGWLCLLDPGQSFLPIGFKGDADDRKVLLLQLGV